MGWSHSPGRRPRRGPRGVWPLGRPASARQPTPRAGHLLYRDIARRGLQIKPVLAACHPVLRCPAAARGWCDDCTGCGRRHDRPVGVTNGACRPLAGADGRGDAAFACDRERTAAGVQAGRRTFIMSPGMDDASQAARGARRRGAGPCGEAPASPRRRHAGPARGRVYYRAQPVPGARRADGRLRAEPTRREEDETQAMEWVHDPTDQAATLIAGDACCRVWQTAGGTWAALISVRGDATAAYSFPSREEAQAWCEAQLAARRQPRA